jgi:hypothetical protein
VRRGKIGLHAYAASLSLIGEGGREGSLDLQETYYNVVQFQCYSNLNDFTIVGLPSFLSPYFADTGLSPIALYRTIQK